MTVYSLVAEREGKPGQAIPVVADFVKLAEGQTLTPDAISVAGQDDKDVKHSARRGAWIAYQELRERGVVHPKSEISQFGVTFDFSGGSVSHISGPSAGLCFLVTMAQEIIRESCQLSDKEVRTFDIAATGILADFTMDKEIQRVNAITEKIDAALSTLESGGIVFYPKANEPLDAAQHAEANKKHISLVAVDTPSQTLDVLLEKYSSMSPVRPYDPPSDPPPGPKLKTKSDDEHRLPPGVRALLAGIAVLIISVVSWHGSQSLFSGPGDKRDTSPAPIGGPTPSPRKAPPAPLAKPEPTQPVLSWTAPKTNLTSLPTKREVSPPPPTPIPHIKDPTLYYERSDEGRSTFYPLPTGEALKDNQRFRIRIPVEQPCYLYVFEVDSQNRISWLFPDKREASLFSPGEHVLPLDADEQWLVDDVKGKETVFVFATPTRSHWLHDMRDRIDRGGALRESKRQQLQEHLIKNLENRHENHTGTLKRVPFQHE